MSSVEPKVTVHLTNGEALTFFLHDDQAIEAKLGPEAQTHLFEPAHLLFGNESSLVGLRTSSIAWIRVHDSVALPWEFPFGADLIEWIPQETFSAIAPLKCIATKLTITHEPVGTAIQVFLRIFCGDGTVHHFRSTTHTLSKAMRLSLPELLGKLHVYFGKHPEGGWVIMNTQTIKRWEIHPGPVALADAVWPLVRMEEGAQ